MTKSQKLMLRQSEIRERLGKISLLEGDALVEEIRSERDGLLTELRESEPQLRAAVASEETENRARDERADRDGESAEVRSLIERSSLTRFVGEAIRQSPISGAESELRSAILGEHARPGLVPWEMLDDRRGRDEHRADAATSVTDNSGSMSHPVLGRIFADTAAAYLGVVMDSVPRGTASYPVLSAGVTAENRAKGAVKDAQAATIGVETLSPTRLTARYLVSQEDLARIDMLEEGLRIDLSGALSEAMDKQVLNGNGTAPNVQGFLGALTQADVPSAVVGFTGLVALAAGAVDGRGARSIQESRTLVSAEAYAVLAGLFNQTGDVSASDYLVQRSGGFRASALLPDAPTSGARDNVSETLAYRTMAPGSAVCPIWAGFELQIRDEATHAASGQVAITAIALWSFKMLRASGYQRGAVKLA